MKQGNLKARGEAVQPMASCNTGNTLKKKKKLIVTATRNEATRIKEAGIKSGEHRLDGIAERTTVSVTPRIDHQGKAKRMVEAKADKVNINTLSSHIQVNIPKIPLISNFK